MNYSESKSFLSFKQRFKIRLKNSDLNTKIPLTFYKANKKTPEKVTNVTEIQVISAIFYTLKVRNTSISLETFLRYAIPAQSLSKSQFEQRVFTKENFEISQLLANFLIDLVANCKSCSSHDFCYNCWLCLNQFFLAMTYHLMPCSQATTKISSVAPNTIKNQLLERPFQPKIVPVFIPQLTDNIILTSVIDVAQILRPN